jgi:hypothetical protein
MTEYELIDAYHVRDWLRYVNGEFTYNDVARFMLRGAHDNLASAMALQMALEGLVETGELERTGTKWGHYRQPKNAIERLDITHADDSPVDIFLPFGMHRLVNILPGNIITIGGEKNSGKTATLLNLAFDNRDRFDVHYFNSEMGAGEVRLRCIKYCESNRVGFSEWEKVNFYERSDNFSDVIFTGKRALNIIDFYECHDEFYKMGEGIRKIHDRLDGGLAFIAIQKNPGNDDPVGGRRVTEKSRVHVSISYTYGKEYPHKLKIDVGKNWADPKVNPRGYCVDYKLANGAFFKIATNRNDSTKHWYYEI